MKNDFKRVFKCPPWEPDNLDEDAVKDFTNNGMIDPNAGPPTPATANQGSIPAGYTYFGQFVDHDLTFDQTALENAGQETRHGSIRNHRTPVLDLDSVYAGVITDHLFVFEEGDFSDLPRRQDETAIIGDPRNDENAIIAQLHLAFMRAHNTLMSRLAGDRGIAFAKSRRILTWLYQWIVVNDFLPRIIHDDVYDLAFVSSGKTGGNIKFNVTKSEIPFEFAFAAYRFGHSMVRDSYQTNNFSGFNAGFNTFIRIFDAASQDDLRGGRVLTKRRIIQWDWFLEMGNTGPFPQKAMPIDTKLVRALSELQEHPIPGQIDNILATRNILRGIRVGVPDAGCVVTEVGKFLHVTGVAVPAFATISAGTTGITREMHHSLWYYILKEAEVQGNGKLGVVGSTILAFTFLWVLRNTENSYFNLEPGWKPDNDLQKNGGPLIADDDNRDDPNWSLASIIRLSGLRVT